MRDSKLNRREFVAAAGATVLLGRAVRSAQEEARPARVAVIGVGGRGTGLLRVLLTHPGVEVPAICDINESHLNRAIKIVQRVRGNTPAGFSKGPYDYRRMLERDDFDGVLIATPAELHAEMAVDTMLAGKHVGSEVPGAYKLEECWNLVKTKEKTGKRYMLLENYNYARYRMMVHNMCRKGMFGDMYYAECSYIHDCTSLRFKSDGSLTWRGELKVDQYGNLYPTHAVGPVSKWLGINRGDRMVSLSSMISRAQCINAYAAKRFGAESKAAQIDFKAGDMSVTNIKTAQGRMIQVFYDSDSPRPASIFYLVQGTEGVYDSRGNRVYIDGKTPRHQWESAGKYRPEFDHDYWKLHGKQASKTGHGGGDYFVMKDLADMVRYDREPWIDVYDSATWSAIVALSRQSVDRGGSSVEFPDFTNGRWREA